MATKQFKGVCTASVNYSIDDEGLVRNVSFVNGCSGNLEGIARLVEGRPAKEVAEILKGLTCGHKNTSCPDQFAQALLEEMNH